MAGGQGQADRVNYLMTRQAKVVAMTCTHAALKRGEFLSLGFKYDNLLMEESAQILEIETFIPLLLQVWSLILTYSAVRGLLLRFGEFVAALFSHIFHIRSVNAVQFSRMGPKS